MSERDDGGPAFPLTRESSFSKNYEGMTLRDWFAGQADISSALGLLHREGCENLIGKPMPDDFVDMVRWHFDVVAALRMIAADAMLEARK